MIFYLYNIGISNKIIIIKSPTKILKYTLRIRLVKVGMEVSRLEYLCSVCKLSGMKRPRLHKIEPTRGGMVTESVKKGIQNAGCCTARSQVFLPWTARVSKPTAGRCRFTSKFARIDRCAAHDALHANVAARKSRRQRQDVFNPHTGSPPRTRHVTINLPKCRHIFFFFDHRQSHTFVVFADTSLCITSPDEQRRHVVWSH